jgi:hypothetical protein
LCAGGGSYFSECGEYIGCYNWSWEFQFELENKWDFATADGNECKWEKLDE